MSAGIPAIVETAIEFVLVVPIANGYFTTRVRLSSAFASGLGDNRRNAGGRCLLVGVVAGAHQRARFDVAETHLERFGLQFGKLARRVQARHGQVVARGAQILADGEDVAVDGGEIAEDLEQFVTSLRRGRP